MKKFKYELNQELKDVVTGYQGIVMVRCEYATGCLHYGLQAPMDKDGKVPAWEYMDESRLIPTGYNLQTLKRPDAKDTSGPCGNPPQW